MDQETQHSPEWIARQRVDKHFDGANSKSLANLNSQGKGPKPYKKNRIVWYRYEDLLKHFTGVEQ